MPRASIDGHLDAEGPKPCGLLREQTVTRDDHDFGEPLLDVFARQNGFQGEIRAIVAFFQNDSGALPSMGGEDVVLVAHADNGQIASSRLILPLDPILYPPAGQLVNSSKPHCVSMSTTNSLRLPFACFMSSVRLFIIFALPFRISTIQNFLGL